MYRPALLSQEQLGAIKLFGARVVVRDGMRVEEPAQGANAVRGLLRAGAFRDDEAMALLLADAGVSGPGVKWFTDRKVVVRQRDEDGGGLEVHPRIPGVTADNLSEYADTEAEFGGAIVDEVIDDKPLVYKLNTIFTDVTLLDKLQLSSRRVQTAKRLAMSDPAGAAASLASHLRANGFPNCRVTAGDYAKTDARAKQAIGEMASTILYKDTHAPANVTPISLRMTFDGFSEKTLLWTVSGPLKYASQVQAIYQLSIHYGPDRVLFMLGEETLRLGIEIYNEKLCEYYNGQVRGYSSLSGILPRDSTFPSELTADQKSRLLLAAKKIAPVCVGDAVIGTAVQVSDRHVIMNEHTLVEATDADKVPTLYGLPVYESRSVGHDIAMVKRDGVSARWILREADVGERVVLCFSVGDGVEYSEVLRVLGVHKDSLKLSASDILRKGASGAAVVSLRDSALLGIFSTKRGANVMCASFTSASFGMVADLESVASSEYVGTPSLGGGNMTYDRMVRRGFLGFLEGINSATMSVYTRTAGVNELAGLVANVGGTWVTTVNPDVAQLYTEDARPLSFTSEVGGKYVMSSGPQIDVPLPNVRMVEPGERVFVFTKSGNEVAMSTVRVVTHCYSDARQFVVEDFGDSDVNMLGALIVAEKDAAVVGQYMTREGDLFGSQTVRCVPLATVPAASGRTSLDIGIGVADAVREWTDGAPSVSHDLSAYGRYVLHVIGGRIAFSRGIALVEGGEVVADELRGQRDGVLAALGWTDSDSLFFQTMDAQEVFEMCVGMAYVKDPLGTSGKLAGFAGGTELLKTPVIPEFPFPRPSSTTTVVSTGSPVVSEERLRELEQKFDMLSKMVVRS